MDGADQSLTFPPLPSQSALRCFQCRPSITTSYRPISLSRRPVARATLNANAPEPQWIPPSRADMISIQNSDDVQKCHYLRKGVTMYIQKVGNGCELSPANRDCIREEMTNKRGPKSSAPLQEMINRYRIGIENFLAHLD
jgi:hypothetical protein